MTVNERKDSAEAGKILAADGSVLSVVKKQNEWREVTPDGSERKPVGFAPAEQGEQGEQP